MRGNVNSNGIGIGIGTGIGILGMYGKTPITMS